MISKPTGGRGGSWMKIGVGFFREIGLDPPQGSGLQSHYGKIV